jgi:hypothetical protein
MDMDDDFDNAKNQELLEMLGIIDEVVAMYLPETQT